MVSSLKIFILLSLLPLNMILGAQASLAQPGFSFHYCENTKGNFTNHNSSTYRANLYRTLTSLRLQSHGFYSSSFGQIPDQVHALGLCRGDAEPHVCRDCLSISSRLLADACPVQKEAFGGLDFCGLRYSNRSMTGLLETKPRLISWDNQTISSNSSVVFFRNLGTLLNDLTNQTYSAGVRFGKYSVGNISAGFEAQSIFAIVQCTPDLSSIDCINCLEEAFVEIRPNDRKLGGRVITPSCNFRYETYRFYNELIVLSDSPAPPSTNTTVKPAFKERKRSKTFGTAGLVVSASSIALIISVGVYTRVKKGNYAKDEEKNEDQDDTSFEKLVQRLTGCVKFDFRALKFATGNFSDKNLIGRNIFGAVYRGVLSDGQRIVVEIVHNEFQHLFKSEVLFGARLQHSNLVGLSGFCLGSDKLLLVIEFFPLSLDHFLFDRNKYLSWNKRHKIIKGIASALCYLHEAQSSPIIHGAIKSTKILLDGNFNPKISCFGSTKYFRFDGSDQNTTRILGTVGYLAPEVFMVGEVTTNSDIFSFGVLLLEIISSKRSGSFWREHEESFTSYAYKNWKDRTISNFIDPRILNSSSQFVEICWCIHIGLLCVQTKSSSRPTMSSVVSMLSSDSYPLPNHHHFEDYSHDIVTFNENESFDSASESSLPPITTPNHEVVWPRGGGVMAKLHYFKYRVVESLLSKICKSSKQSTNARMCTRA